MLEARNLYKSYGDRTVVKDVSFNINRGEIVGLLGQNGAGKTTCFDMVVGIVKPDSGSVLLDGQPLTQYSIDERARFGISYLCQEPSAFRKLTVEENIRLIWEVNNFRSSEQTIHLRNLLEEFEIDHLAETKAINLSGGERRRLEIARAVAQDPDYLLLDEPFTGVDPIAIAELEVIIRKLIKRRNIGILLTDHNPKATLAITDRAYIVQEGKILVGGTAKEIAHNELARRYYLGKDFRL